MTFRPTDPHQNPVTVPIDEQGNYKAILPVGLVKVCVDNRHLAPPPPPQEVGIPGDLKAELRRKLGLDRPLKRRPQKPVSPDTGQSPDRYVPIPERYYDAETSSLDFTVEPGTQQHDILLKH